jgi:hypothetical protein
MQNYQKMIQHFFEYCQVKITEPYIENSKPKSATEYSVLYTLKEHPIPGHNKSLIDFNFKEDDTSISLIANYVYSGDGKKYGFCIDSKLLKEKAELGKKCMVFFKTMSIMHYCPVMTLIFKMDKRTKEIEWLDCYQSINIIINMRYSEDSVNLENYVNEMIEKEFEVLNEDPSGMGLSDKLDLFHMSYI